MSEKTCASNRKKVKSGLIHEFRRNSPLFLMCLPYLILIIVFAYLPMFGLMIAFKKINMRDGIFFSPWCGFDNFKLLFASNDAWTITRNTLGYNLFFIVIDLILAVGLALILHSIINKKTSKVYQTILMMPHFLSYVIVAYLALAFLNVENGSLNQSILPALGFDTINNPINWFAESKYWPFILTLIHVWKTAGYGSIVYLAALAGIDNQLYEAAEIDGANVWQKIWYITIPSLKVIITIKTILAVGTIFGGDFGLFFNVTQNQGALYETTQIIPVYIYNMLTGAGSSSLGYSSAASFLQSILGFLLVIITNEVAKRVDDETALF